MVWVEMTRNSTEYPVTSVTMRFSLLGRIYIGCIALDGDFWAKYEFLGILLAAQRL